ncbi:MAG: DUF1674 domain-containing protein [Beijerinckiaceae bacterium]|nr:DUF1674 domain-containing protein [Beijerinckiaceae bacterium]MCI0736224.1 DUF1674 domain-containing protein [Beijerinckiaceae bacterium]
MRQAEGKTSVSPFAGAEHGEPAHAAQRALAEAEERRRRQKSKESAAPNEVHGRGGLDPARYGDWEVKGIASDF